MISVYKIKPAFQKILMPVLKWLHALGVTANQITIASIVLSAFIGVLFWKADQSPIFFLSLPIGLLFRMALNALDGMMARTYNQQSKKGEVLNELGDVVSDLFIFFPLLLHESHIILVIVTFICLSILNEYSGILAKALGGERRYEGPMGKSDRALILAIYGVLQFLRIDLSHYSYWIFILICLLLTLSTSIRIIRSLR